MDILGSIAIVTSSLVITHPRTGDPIGLKLELQSMESPAMKAIQRQITDEAQRLRIRGKFIKADEIDNNSNELYITAIVDWEWSKGSDGQPLTLDGDPKPPCNIVNKKTLIERVPGITSQIDDALGQQNRFFR